MALHNPSHINIKSNQNPFDIRFAAKRQWLFGDAFEDGKQLSCVTHNSEGLKAKS